jgi:hypothetical protein
MLPLLGLQAELDDDDDEVPFIHIWLPPRIECGAWSDPALY